MQAEQRLHRNSLRSSTAIRSNRYDMTKVKNLNAVREGSTSTTLLQGDKGNSLIYSSKEVYITDDVIDSEIKCVNLRGGKLLIFFPDRDLRICIR